MDRSYVWNFRTVKYGRRDGTRLRGSGNCRTQTEIWSLCITNVMISLKIGGRCFKLLLAIDLATTRTALSHVRGVAGSDRQPGLLASSCSGNGGMIIVC
jgi:hypothetical protein